MVCEGGFQTPAGSGVYTTAVVYAYLCYMDMCEAVLSEKLINPGQQAELWF